jgi:hypothetical protein
MSRTDKDRPYRVRAMDPLEPGRYERHWHDFTRRWFIGQRPDIDHCDLGTNPYADWRNRDWCTFELESWAYSPWRNSHKDERRVIGHKPHRARARRDLEQIRQEFNAGIREEWDVFSPQHRHSVDWLVS